MDLNKIRIIQITDTHLFEDANGSLMDVCTRDTLNSVLELIRQEYSDSHCLLVTGDLSQDGSTSSYEALKSALTPLNKPFYWLCGNHDTPDNMASVMPEAMVKQIGMGNWQILLLNSYVPGSVHGHLEQSELDTLESYLAQSPALHTIIAVHHHPVGINSQWMDQIGLKNSSELQAIVEQHHQIKAVIHGHVHQESEHPFAGTTAFATPSTCVQFEPNSDDFKLNNNLPGFRVLDLFPDGRLETKVVRVAGEAPEIDKNTNGY